MVKLSKEEKEIIQSYERGEWKPDPNFKRKKKTYQEMAKATLKKDKRVNIRISQHVLEGIQSRAVKEGIPYQTLMASVLHKYVSGQLMEK